VREVTESSLANLAQARWKKIDRPLIHMKEEDEREENQGWC
jgi:hypothetical protein